MDIAMSDALDAVLREIGDGAAIARFEGERHSSVRAALLQQLARVSTVRYANACHGLYLSFRDVDISEFIDERTASIDADGYLEAVLDASHHGATLAEVLACEASATIR
jgi:hypothetical protein